MDLLTKYYYYYFDYQQLFTFNIKIYSNLKDLSLVITILASILHLTNIKFVYDDESDGVYIEDEYPLNIGKLILNN